MSAIRNIDFFIKRLMRMSPGEIFYRTYQYTQSLLDRRYINNSNFSYEIIAEPKHLFNNLNIAGNTNLISVADRICANRLDVFAINDCYLGKTINYHKDYKSGLVSPQNLFSRRINYRDPSIVGDIKYIWEINRHQFLTKLAIAYKATGNKLYFEKFTLLLEEWFRQNPFMVGVNWISSLELAIRLINWTICLHLLGSEISGVLYKRWLESIYHHCWYINRNYSFFSSANNHLIGEATGLFVASTALPKFRESAGWQDKAYKILISEAIKQNYSDGVNKEQATAYHLYVLDYLMLAGLVGKKYDIDFLGEYWSILEKMCEYITGIENTSGIIPKIGDEDGGYVIDLSHNMFDQYKSILNTASFIFKREDFYRGNIENDLKTILLTNIANIDCNNVLLNNKNLPRSEFEKGGYYILTQNSKSAREEKLIFDCGPLGYLSIAAHGHADALSFYFSAGRTPIFIDPGTYAYHANPTWRNYFRGTSAHNTIRINRLDQSTIAGNFMWSQKATARLINYHKDHLVKGEHDGYKRFKAKHIREIKYEKDNGKWVITDEILGKGVHFIEIFFHLSPECTVGDAAVPGRLDIHFPAGLVFLEVDRNLKLDIYKSSESPIAGWYSPAYDVKLPTTTIVQSASINNNGLFTNKFSVSFNEGCKN